MKCPIILCCPEHRLELQPDKSGSSYVCPSGCFFPIKDNIVRFVPLQNYASSFGYQWNKYRVTQLDSYSGTSISRDRLKQIMGESFKDLKGKKVLEAGCGAGRFTEVLLSEGAQVFAVDLSTAVDANYKNFNSHSNYFVCQGDILKLPVKSKQFDYVICIGVLQATPSPENAIAALCDHVKPGGALFIDHYSRNYHISLSRKFLRAFLLRMPSLFSLRFCDFLTSLFWPIHKFLKKHKKWYFMNMARKLFLRFSPLVDYHDAYPQIGPKLLKAWASMDMHDTVTDYYKHLRDADEIEKHLLSCGMTSVEVQYAGNGVEARAKKSLV